MTIPYQHNCSHSDEGWCLACMKNLAAELEESQQDYNTLVYLLKKRFPQRSDGTMPDFAVEDVLRENEILREIAEYAQHKRDCQIWRPIVGCDCGLKELKKKLPVKKVEND